MQRLAHKIAIVTGGGTGIGEAICKKFAREGAKVVVAGLPSDPVQEVVEEVRRERGNAEAATPFLGDVATDDGAKACVGAAIHAYGALHVLVNNAGQFVATAELPDYDVADIDRTIFNNIRSAVLMTKHALPHLQQTRGVVLGTGSESGEIGLAQNAVYGGTKGFMHAFIRGVAAEQAKYGVRANCVCPGPIDTAWTHKETGPMSAKMEQMVTQATLLGRRGTPEEMANVFAFLASDEASYVTGALWFADGGTTIAKGPAGSEAESEVAEQPKPTLDLRHQHQGLENKVVHEKV